MLNVTSLQLIDPKQVMEDSTRDKWLTSQEALKYGIIDEVIGLK